MAIKEEVVQFDPSNLFFHSSRSSKALRTFLVVFFLLHFYFPLFSDLLFPENLFFSLKLPLLNNRFH